MRTLIGVVTGAKLDKNEERIAWIWPLVETNGSKWETIRNHQQEFPDRGYIFWPKAPGVEKGDLVHFRAREANYFKEGGDDFMVTDVRPLHEVLDLRSLGDCEQVRNALARGITLPQSVPSKLLVWCRDNFFVGPLQLSTSNGVTTIDKSKRERLSCFQFNESEILSLQYEHFRWSVIPRPSLGSPYCFVDWDDDKAVSRRALELAMAQSGAAPIDRPRQFIDAAIEALTKNGTNPDIRLGLYRLERGKLLASDVGLLTSMAKDVIASLRAHPIIVSELDALKEEIRKTARADAEAGLAAEREELARLRSEVRDAKSSLETLEAGIQEAEARANSQVKSIELQIHNRVLEALSNAPALLTDVALLRPFLGASPTKEIDDSVLEDTPLAAWKPTSVRVANPKELRTRLNQAFKAFAVSTTSYQPLHAAFAGGLLPVVSGSRSVEALLAYSHVATGGRALVLPITSAIADVENLFGHVSGDRFVPHASGLIDIVRAAKASDGLYLIVLDGINRGATDSYLLPLIRSALRRTTKISLFHRSALRSSDPYRALGEIEWPRNLLLAATVVEGPTTIPVALDVWTDSAYIQTTLGESGIRLTELPSEPSELDAAILLDTKPSSEHCDWIKELIPRSLSAASRFEGGYKLFSNDKTALQDSITRSVLVPHVASMSDDKERDTLTKSASKSTSAELASWVALARRQIG